MLNLLDTRWVTIEAIEKSVYQWLSTQFEHIEHGGRFPEFIAYRDGHKYGFEVISAPNWHIARLRLNELMHRAYHSIKKGEFQEFSIVLVLMEMDDRIDRLINVIKKHWPSNENINIILGAPVDVDQEGRARGFHVLEQIRLSDLV